MELKKGILHKRQWGGSTPQKKIQLSFSGSTELKEVQCTAEVLLKAE